MKPGKPIQKIYRLGLAAALPLFITALIFNFPLAFSGRFLPGTDLSLLGYIMEAEFLAVATGIVLILPLLFTPNIGWVRWCRRLIFAGAGFGFCWLAFNIGGRTGMISYAMLVFVSFGGGSLFMFDVMRGVTRAFLSLLRWSAAIFLYVSLQLEFNLDSDISVWKNTTDVISFGAAFFYSLLLLEVLVYPWLVYYLERRLHDNEHDAALKKIVGQ